ncbi:glycosyltransferase family 4 protein [Patescibacteria group bacterium]|nr:glycosyltransferase family 4 protein [Patescibacteria group bacterium]
MDALFCASGAVPPFMPVPFYPWAHDVAIFKHPEWFPQSKFKRLITTNLFLRGIRKAKHVFAVSEDTKDTLVEVARIHSDRVTVTYQGIKTTQAEPEAKYGEYALIVGTIEPRKNIPFIINLWEEVRAATNRDLKLVIAGKMGWGNVSIPKRDWLIRIDAPSDEERDRLYAGASVLLMPSLYEGFGRMALEAMALGTPVIASNQGAIPEVVGGSGLLLDPQNRQGWIKAISDLLGHEQLRAGLVAGGRLQAQKFSWEKTARIILAKIAEDW